MAAMAALWQLSLGLAFTRLFDMSMPSNASAICEHLPGAECRGLVFVHVGKAGGDSVHKGLRVACGIGVCNVLVDVHTCDKAIEGVLEYVDRWGPTVYTNGPLVASPGYEDLCEAEKAPLRARSGVPPTLARTDRLGALVRTLPIVLWVRDPVARVIASWDFFVNMHSWHKYKEYMLRTNQSLFLPDGSPIRTSEVTRFLRHAAGPELGLGGLQEGVELGRVLAAMREKPDPLAVARRVFRHVDHILTGLAFYVGGVRGLEALRPRLLFVGAVETMQQSWDQLEAAVYERLGPGPLRRKEKLPLPPHTHASRSGRPRRPVSPEGLEQLRALVREDSACLQWLHERGHLSAAYLQRVRGRSTYDYEPPPESEKELF